MPRLQSVKGMNDVLPPQTARWQHVETAFRRVVQRAGFREVRFPVVEPTELFVRSLGEHTDIVEKEMYSFVDKGGDRLTLRPEGTASAVRAYLQHGVGSQQPVVRWYYLGPMFRRERPARGRYRQFHQLGLEVFGDPGPLVDAELIQVAWTFYRELDLQRLRVRLGTLGGEQSRSRLRQRLLAHYEPLEASLCPDCRRRLRRNPLRLLDCKVPADAERAAEAPSVFDVLEPEDRAHFDAVCEALDALGVPFEVDRRLVRGLDYYNRTLFEFVGSGGQLGAQDALGGGGRYDRLVELLGGPPTPAIGFALGLERLLLVLQDEVRLPRPDAFVVAARPGDRLEALRLACTLRDEGLHVELDLRGGSLRSQLRRAGKLDARFALILGEQERAEGRVQVRDLEAHQTAWVGRAELLGWLRSRLRPGSAHRPSPAGELDEDSAAGAPSSTNT